VTAPHPTPVLVIGVGNDLRGDDAAGLIVARTVAGWGRPGVRVVECRQLLPDLVPEVAAAGRVVFVDAAVGGPPTGNPVPVTAAVGTTPLTHSLSPRGLLGLTHQLAGRAPPGWVVPVPAGQFDYGAGISAVCRAGIEAAIRQLATILPGRPATQFVVGNGNF